MKYIRLLYPFAGAVAGTILTIPDDSVEAAVKSGVVEVVGQEVATGETIDAPDTEPTPAPVKKKKPK